MTVYRCLSDIPGRNGPILIFSLPAAGNMAIVIPYDVFGMRENAFDGGKNPLQ